MKNHILTWTFVILVSLWVTPIVTILLLLAFACSESSTIDCGVDYATWYWVEAIVLGILGCYVTWLFLIYFPLLGTLTDYIMENWFKQ